MNRRTLSLHWIATAAMLQVSSWGQAQGLLELSAGIYRIRAEVVNTYESRAEGLMFRKSLSANSGMLFVFDQTAKHCMWMRNTLIPLSVAFVDEQGHILNVEEMSPQTEDSHCATKPAKFALEMNVGWFKSRGLGQGVMLVGLDKAPPAR
ncbi:MAG: DUF192 domain-containing protein [Sterolibacterium sp.]